MKKELAVLLLVGILLTVSFAALAEQKAWEKINWNAPVPWTERLLADHYILPTGWQEATKGVSKIVFLNSGSLTGDIATYTNMLRFQQLTGIKVEAIPMKPGLALAKGTSILMSGDTSVDAVLANNPTFDLATLAATGKLTPVDNMWPKEVRELYNPHMSDYLGWGGHYYLLPVTYIGHPIFYRPSWLREAGVTVPSSFTEMLQAFAKIKKIKPAGYYPLIFTGEVPDLFEAYLPLIYSQGGRLFKNGRYQFDSVEAKNALSWLAEVIRKGYAPPDALSWIFAGTADFFLTGKAGFVLGLSSGSAYPFKASPNVGADFSAMAPPKWSPETPDEYAGRATVGCNSMLINDSIGDNYKAAVMLFGDYLRSLEAQRNELFVEGNDSGLLYIWEHANEELQKVDWGLAQQAAHELGITPPTPVKSVADIPGFEGRHKAAMNAIFEIFPPGFNKVMDDFAAVFAKVVKGEITIDEALHSVQVKAEATLK